MRNPAKHGLAGNHRNHTVCATRCGCRRCKFIHASSDSLDLRREQSRKTACARLREAKRHFIGAFFFLQYKRRLQHVHSDICLVFVRMWIHYALCAVRTQSALKKTRVGFLKFIIQCFLSVLVEFFIWSGWLCAVDAGHSCSVRKERLWPIGHALTISRVLTINSAKRLYRHVAAAASIPDHMHICGCVNGPTSLTALTHDRKVITLRMHVVNLILFENDMSEWSVFAQHNSPASQSVDKQVLSDTCRPVACPRLDWNVHCVYARYQYAMSVWHEIRGHRNESWKYVSVRRMAGAVSNQAVPERSCKRNFADVDECGCNFQRALARARISKWVYVLYVFGKYR